MPQPSIKVFNHKKYRALNNWAVLNLGHCWLHSSRISSEQKLALVSLVPLPPFMSKTDQSRSDLKIEEERTLETRATGSNAKKKKKKRFVKLIECNIQKRCFYFNYFLTTCGKMYHSLCLACWTGAFGTKQGTVGASQAFVPGAQRADGIERHHAVGK